MKRYTLYILMLLSAAILSGCVDEGDMIPEDQKEIVLRSSLTTASLSVKSEGYDYDTTVPGGLNLSMWRWDEGDASTDVRNKDILDATLGGDPDPTDDWRRDIHFQPAQYYKNRTSQVGFRGFFPKQSHTGWQKTGEKLISDDRKMTFKIDGQTDVMFSDFKKGDFTNGVEHLTFAHALCRYRVYVYAVDEDARNQWGRLTDVSFMNLPEELFVQLPQNFADESQNITYSFTPAPANKNEYTPVHVVQGQEIELPVGSASRTLIGTYLGGAPAINVLGVNAATVNFKAPEPVSIAREYQPGYTYNIILRFSTHGVINVDVVTEEWKSEGKYTITEYAQFYDDLSRYGTSNSYVVSSSNMAYCFDATIKGNGVNTVTRYDGQVFTLPDTDVHLSPKSVRILSSDSKLIWNGTDDYSPPDDDDERHGDIIRLLSTQVIDGKVLFEVIGLKDENGAPLMEKHRLLRKGNVRIGVFDTEDPNDPNANLLWSWHLWVTDRPRNYNYGNGYVSMDRNLGAVSTDPADYDATVPVLSGCLYQWGRKDPFFIHELQKHPEYTKEGPVSISYAHKYPRSFFKIDSLSYKANHIHDWTIDSSPHLWGWASERDNLVKTLYDPCPPGYRVNGNALWEFPGGERMSPVEVRNNDETDGLGYYFGIENYVDVYYPATTFIHHDGRIVRNVDPHDADNKHAYVFRYSATPYVSDDPNEQGLAYHFRYNIEDSKNGKPFLIYDWDHGGGRVQAFPVRCVYEDSRHEITDLSREQTANSYILDHARFFKFNATVPGNAVGALNVQFNNGTIRNITLDGGVSKTLAVDKVDVLWWQGDLKSGSPYMEAAKNNLTQEQMQDMCPVKVVDGGKLDENGDVLIQVPQDKLQNANIIMAGYDVTGTILWTWHLWMLPDGVSTVRLGDYSVLDRNLGATYAPGDPGDIDQNNVLATHGFFYQRGRKDPFVARQSYNQENNRDYSSPWFYKSYDGQWRKITDLQQLGRRALNIIETIKNPTLFANSGRSSWQDVYESETNNDGPINQMWGYTGVEGAWGDTFAKTMWDPCPPGYKVAHHIVFNSGGLWNPNTGAVEDYQLYYNGVDSSEYGLWLVGDRANGGMYSNGVNTGSNQIYSDGLWLPNTWRIAENGNYQRYNNNSKSGYMHSACPYSGARTRTFRWYQSDTQYANTSHDNGVYLSNGTVIRCLKE